MFNKTLKLWWSRCASLDFHGKEIGSQMAGVGECSGGEAGRVVVPPGYGCWLIDEI